MNKQSDILKIIWHEESQGSVEGVDYDPANPFHQALQNLLDEGKPIDRLTLCYCTEVDDNTGSAILYWLGVFVLSVAGRIVFFPGFTVTDDHFLKYKGTKLLEDRIFKVNHFTLESDLTWHITSPKSRKHIFGYKAVNVGDQLFLWFGMSISNLSVLKPVKKDTIINVKLPSSDSKRRIQNFMNSREGAIFQIVKFHPEARNYSKDGFFHMVFIKSTKATPDYRGNNFALPYGSLFISPPILSESEQIPVQSHRISLSSEIDIQIIAMRLPGSLTTPILLTSQAS